ncbi:glycerol-3-phosphate O-acyltransferase 1 [Diutina catenulata]
MSKPRRQSLVGASEADSVAAATVRKSQTVPIEYHEPPWWRYVWYDMFMLFFRFVFDCFFRDIRPRGAFRLPRSGPVIFVAAPHANQFVDPFVLSQQVSKEANRRVSFLIAAKSYKRKFIGLVARSQLSIPVVRPQDNLRPATGKITIDPVDPLVVRGHGTKFTEECMERGLVALPQSLGSTEVSEIISDTELRIRKEFKSGDKVATLLSKGTKFKVADRVDQKQVYNTVFQHLAHGHCIGIFPEGGSHDRTSLLPLKAGVAIMALGAMDADPTCNVKIVPCGMNYFHAHKFRSRAVVEFGHPIDIDPALVKKYANPETNKDAVKELLDIVQTGLKAVTVTCEDYDTLMLVQAARRLYAGNLAQTLPLPLVVEMTRRLVLGYEMYKDDPRVAALKDKVGRYNEMLKQLHLPDHYVEECDERHKWRVVPVLFVRLLKLMFFFTLALPGATLFSPVFICAKLISRQKANEALKASTVKIKANDVVATWKILISLGIAPIVYSFWATLGTIYCKRRGIWTSHTLFWVWLVLYLCGILVTYSALMTGEQGMDLFKSIRPLVVSLTGGSALRELQVLRKELAEEITDVVNTLGPQLFPNDFNLLEMGDKLSLDKKKPVYVDSDDEEEHKTDELRRRRRQARRHRRTPSGLSEDSRSASVSDGVSLMNSDNSLTNIPMFSDYHLSQNAKNSNVRLDSQFNSQFNSHVSLADDYNNGGVLTPRPHLSRDNSGVELNFSPRQKLSDRIRQKMKEERQRQKEE